MATSAGLQPIRFGILGTARIAPMAVIEPAQRTQVAQVVAIASRSKDKAARFATKYGIPKHYDSYEKLLADPEVQAVYIPLPVSMHAEWSLRAMDAGKDVLCEKPITANATEAEALAAKAEQTGRIIAEALHYRYHPLAERLLELVKSGTIGELRRVEAHLCVPIVFKDAIRYSYELGGGAVMDVGCYAVHLCRLLAQSEPEVVAAESRLACDQVDRWTRAELRFPNGVEGLVVCSIFSPILLRSKATIIGSRGEISAFNPYAPQTFYHIVKIKTEQRSWTEKFPRRSTYEYQLEAFVNAVRTHTFPITGPDDFVNNMKVIDAIYTKAGLRPRGLSPA